jgi:hypothetical protein
LASGEPGLLGEDAGFELVSGNPQRVRPCIHAAQIPRVGGR